MRAASILAPVTLAIVLGTAGPPAFGQDPEANGFDPTRVSWTRLRFRAEKLFLTAYSEVELKTLRTPEVASALIASPRSVALMPSGPQTLLLALESSSGSRDSLVRVWFSPHDAAALQRLKLRGGKKAYKKIFRFTRDGTYSLRTAPENRRQGRLPPEQWGRVEEFFYPVSSGSSCPAISEPSLLFYVISAARLAAGGEPVRICVFSRKSVIPLEIAVRGSRRLAVDYSEASAQAERRRTEEITATEIGIKVPELDDEGEKADFKLLGLGGDVAIFIEESSRIPVQVSGRIPGLGKIDVKLIEVDLKTMGDPP
ncbi:MAG: hypothetical protein GY856_06590 [bacterium]|nr:hypothetical protein [bacterium]